MGQIKNIKLHIVTDIKFNIFDCVFCIVLYPSNLFTMPKTKKDYYDSDSEDEAPRQKKQKKKKKDPNAPKRPTSAYFFYAGDVRPGIREENPGMKITEVASLTGAQWRELGDAEKKPYEEQAAKDKKRYEKEMEAYNQGTFAVR